MTNIYEWRQPEKTLSRMEIINQTKPVYLCVDCELMPTLCTTDRKQAEIYAEENHCFVHFYPVGTYTEQ